MTNRRLRNAGRRKAVFGSEAGAILAAATITSGAQMAASAIGANATRKAAEASAKASIQGAKEQAKSITDQTNKYIEHQQAAQELVKEENAAGRELQNNVQLTLQAMAGQNNLNDRLEASRLTVKNGGSTNKRGLAKMPQFLLRGGNMPFKVTDGGAVLPVGITPEGYDLYEIVGNDHEHYHRTLGGKYKSGVGIRFADGNIVEGEGDQRRRARNGGELMLVTPDNAYFISKHNINGVNPKGLVEQGMHPLQAYAIQEEEKDIIGINDDGTRKAKFGKKKFLIGGTPNIYEQIGQIYPQLNTDTIGDSAAGITYGFKNNGIRSLKCGGSVRRKAAIGTTYRKPTLTPAYGVRFDDQSFRNRPAIVNNGKPVNSYTVPSGSFNSASVGSWFDRNAGYIATGANILGGFIGNLVTNSANRSAAEILANASRESNRIMEETYRNLPTLDANLVKAEDYTASHILPALQAPVSFAASNIAGINRSLQRRLRNAVKYSQSGAAMQDRSNIAEIDAQDQRNRVYSEDQQQMQAIRQQNVQSVNEASVRNAILETEARKNYLNDRLSWADKVYNSKVTKALGIGEYKARGISEPVSYLAQADVANGQNTASMISNAGLTIGNTLSSMAKRRADLENVMLGATTDAQINYIAKNGSSREKQARLNAVRAAIASGKLSSEDEARYRYYESILS